MKGEWQLVDLGGAKSIPSKRKSMYKAPEVREGMHACMLNCVQLFAILWTVAHQAPLSCEIFQARILEWVALSSSRGSSQTWDQTHIS